MQLLKIPLVVFLALVSGLSYTQAWHPVGNDDNNYVFGNAHNYTRIALGTGNSIYLAYQDGGKSNKASVKKYENGAWSYVGAGGFSAGIAEYITIAVENGSTPYIAYRDVSLSYRTVVKKFDGTNWVNVGAASISAGSSNYPSIAIANDGIVYVAYKDNTIGGKIVAKKFDGTAWSAVGGSSGFSAGNTEYVCAAIDHNNVLYVAYSDLANVGKATVKKFDGTNWVTVGTAGFTPQGAQYIDLALYNGMPYISYTDNANGFKASVRRFNNVSWESVGTDGFSTDIVNYTAIALDNSGTPYVAYQDFSTTANGKATVKKFNGISWQTVGTEGLTAVTADYPDLAITSANVPIVSYTRFEIFARSYSLYVLPLRLLSFSARQQNEKTGLYWTTAEEQNTSHFVIERSSNGRDFYPIGQVAAAGTAVTQHNYYFTDTNTVQETSYYRLKMIDLDGRFQYSTIVVIDNRRTGAEKSVYPNPAKDAVTISLTVKNSQTIEYSLIDLTGRKIFARTTPLNKGINVINIPLSNYPKGSYLLLISGREIKETMKIIKQ